MIRSEALKRNKKIIERYLSGETPRYIGATVGLSTQGIHYILDKNKIPKRKALDKKI